MSLLHLQCPLCAGSLEIDPAHLGQQVQCPLCQGLLQLPTADAFGLPAASTSIPPFGPPPPPALGPPPDFGMLPADFSLPPGTFGPPPGNFGPPPDFGQLPPPPPPMGAPPSTDGGDWNTPLSLGCPVCQQPFQVTLALAGQTVACPHCSQPVGLPPHDIFQQMLAPAAPPPPPMGVPAEMPPMGSAVTSPPMGTAVSVAPSDLPPKSLPPSISQGTAAGSLPPSVPAPPKPDPTRDTFRQRQTFTAPKPEQRPTAPTGEVKKPRNETPEQRLKRKEEQRRRAAEAAQPPGSSAPPKSPPPKPTPPVSEKKDAPPPPERNPLADLLPPGAGAIDLLPPGAGVSDLLPPTASPSAPRTTVDLPPTSGPQTTADVFLPPSATGAGGAIAPGEQKALPDAPKPQQAPAPKGAPGTVVLPTADGRFVAVRESTKTLGRGEDEIELRKLTPDEKMRRRAVRNFILSAFCLTILGVVLYIMLRRSA